jgi:hypothetical protein
LAVAVIDFAIHSDAILSLFFSPLDANGYDIHEIKLSGPK